VTINGTYTSDLNTDTYLLGTINNRGNIQLNGGAGTNSFLVIDSANVTLQGGGTVTLSTNAGGGAAYILQAAGGLNLENVDNTIQGSGIIGVNGLSLLNDAGGRILANAPGQALYINGGGTLTNNGTMQVNPGSLLLVQNVSFTNFASNTLTGGTYSVAGTTLSPGTLQIAPLGNTGGEIVNNAANIILDGVNSNLVDGAGLDAMSNFSNNTAAGRFTITNGRAFNTAGDFSNAGAVEIGASSVLNVNGGGGSYTQSGGSTRIDGSLRASGGVDFGAGTLEGIGTIVGNVTLSGTTIQPGDAPGTLTIQGDYSQTGGVYNELISSSANGLLDVFGRATLGPGAELNINLLNGFIPMFGETFTIMEFASSIGFFANAPGGIFTMDSFQWQIAYNPTDIVLTFESVAPPTVPEPSTLILIATGLGVCLGWRRLHPRGIA